MQTVAMLLLSANFSIMTINFLSRLAYNRNHFRLAQMDFLMNFFFCGKISVFVFLRSLKMLVSFITVKTFLYDIYLLRHNFWQLQPSFDRKMLKNLNTQLFKFEWDQNLIQTTFNGTKKFSSSPKGARIRPRLKLSTN